MLTSEQAYDVLKAQCKGKPAFDGERAYWAIALFAATGKVRIGTQGQAWVAATLMPEGAKHSWAMKAFDLAEGDNRRNVIARLGTINGQRMKQSPKVPLVNAVRIGTGAGEHFTLTLTEAGQKAVEAFGGVDKARGKVTTKGRKKPTSKPRKAPQPVANEPVVPAEAVAEPVA